jgi:hypothetical protein
MIRIASHQELAMADNARANRRLPTNTAGLAKFDGKEVAVLLRDRSEGGARVRGVGSSKLPDRFRLVVPLEKIDTDCVVVWRRGSDCGVKFEP